MKGGLYVTNKILFCATVDYHFKAFHLPYMKWFKEQGWEVHIVASGNLHLPYTDKKYNIPIKRSPFRRANIAAYKQLKEIIHQNNYSIIHCHTPLGGLLTRLAARKARLSGTKVIYTAHGFHFCKGVPVMNWFIYYPIEKYLSRYTDSLITINQEDFDLARSHRFRASDIKYINGVGVDTELFKPLNKEKQVQLKIVSGYRADEVLLFNAGEFNKNKNQKFLIHMMVHLLKHAPQARLLLAGEGKLLNECKQLAQTLGIASYVTFLGFRSDIESILPMCDVAVAASYREGLPVNIMESMACGLPVVAVENRGHRELIHNDINGWLIQDWDELEFANKVLLLMNQKLRISLGREGQQIAKEKYSTNQILQEKAKVYTTYMDRRESETWMAH